MSDDNSFIITWYVKAVSLNDLKIVLVVLHMIQTESLKAIDDYAKDGGPEVAWHLCSFYQDPLRS